MKIFWDWNSELRSHSLISGNSLIFSITIESCTLNYCQDGIIVYYGTETQQYTFAPLYGRYELQPGYVNGRPYFKMGVMYIWWDGVELWCIGYDSYVGQSLGHALYLKDAFCPHQLSELNWYLFDGHTVNPAGNYLGITCKHFLIE